MGNRFRFLPGLILLGTVGLQAPAQTPAEREFLVNHLQKTRANLEEATKGLSAAQWHFKPSPFKWSVAECMEHIALAEGFIFDLIKGQVMNAPAPPVRDAAEVKKGDEAVLNTTADRTVRFQPPQPTRPIQQAASNRDDLLKQFKASRERTIEFTRTAQDMRGHCTEGPVGPCMDAYQFLLLISGHSERHTVQLLQVRADPNFPKR